MVGVLQHTLAGKCFGGPSALDSPALWVHHPSPHANGACTRQPHHPPSTHLDMLKVEKSQLEAGPGHSPGSFVSQVRSVCSPL